VNRVGAIAARYIAVLFAAQIVAGLGTSASAQDGGTPVLADIEPPPGAAVLITPSEPDSFARGFTAVGNLEPGSVLRIQASQFAEGDGSARQCVQSDVLRCANQLPVVFDFDGGVTFHYALGDPADAAAGGCGPTGDRCFVLIEDNAGGRAEIDTIFGAEARPDGSVGVVPRRPIAESATVEVSVTDFPPGTATVLLCSAPAVSGSERCRRVSEPGALQIGADGAGALAVTVTPGSVGTERLPCEWRHDCAISVESDEAFARAPARLVTFSAPTGAGYNATRLLIGLAIAALLLGVALWLIFFTDWSPVGEEVAPEIDEADYADLDEIIASLEPVEEHDLV